MPTIPSELPAHRPQPPARYVVRKLPNVTALFWALKIAATTLGETGGDLVAQTLHVGYLVSTAIFLAAFLVAVDGQIKAGRFHPAIFWTVIALSSTAGTTLSDLMNRTGGIGYTGGAHMKRHGKIIELVDPVVVPKDEAAQSVTGLWRPVVARLPFEQAVVLKRA